MADRRWQIADGRWQVHACDRQWGAGFQPATRRPSWPASIGTSTLDYALVVNNPANTVNYLAVRGNGTVGIGGVPYNENLSVVGTDVNVPSLGNRGGNLSVLTAGARGLVAGNRSDGSFFMQVQRTDGPATAYHLLLQPNGGNVGVGTATPVTLLSNRGTVTPWITAPDGISWLSQPSSAGYAASIVGSTAGGASGAYGLRVHTDAATTADYPLVISSGANATARLVVRGDGSVGIGMLSPAYPLDVAGSSRISGDLTVTGQVVGGVIHATYQDVAEWVPSGKELAAGTVVVLDREHRNQVRPSDHAYDTAVAGVVSQQPGIVLGESGPTKSKVATTGRVRVKVCANAGPIAIGDLLVTSDVIGEAMRSEPVNVAGIEMHRPGTVIGKALEPLPSGSSEILVLLSLQ